MTDPKQIPFLVQLLDDESWDVQKNIMNELASFGPNLRKELRRINFSLSSQQKSSINRILNAQKHIWIQKMWFGWMNEQDEMERLEKGLSVLSSFLHNPFSETKLPKLLDALAHGYRAKYRVCDPKLLAHFLFKRVGLKGDEDDYYDPQNNNLIYVIQQKKGIPISLACIYMLVGHRLGLHIEGCHFPGHFLARIQMDGRTAFVDCFSEGQIIYEEDIIRVREDMVENIEEILQEKADTDTIIRRFLANLTRSYQLKEDEDESEFMIKLFKELDDHFLTEEFEELSPEDIIVTKTSDFTTGQIVRHKRYGYRGIIVDIDEACEATDSWYYSNQTQPERDQPWLHVLVDGTDQVTYVAESNLECDENEDKIEHPLLSYFFNETTNGEYIRNENTWPEIDL